LKEAGIMGFTEAITIGFQKYVVFSGRARRPEYWYWMLFYFMVTFALSIVDQIVFGVYVVGFDVAIGVLSSIASLALLLPGLAVLARRLHDTDRSAWWILLGLVLLVGAIILLIWICMRGTRGPNRFGPEPA
jgi:uncharacterized membrane protein YhaH (DUF805 family)